MTTTYTTPPPAVPPAPGAPAGPPGGRPRRRRGPLARVLVVLGLVVVLFVGAVVAVVGVAWARAATSTAGAVEFTRPLAVPPLAESRVEDGVRVFELEARAGVADLGASAPTPTIGLNGDYLGPTLRAARGERVRVDVTNALDETTTLHWHGMHLPPAMDGGPHQMVEPGETWSPTWTIDQPAATLWYHPHLHGRTASQVYRGLAGMFLLDDPAAADGPAAGLPHEYGVDDVPVILQDKSFHPDGRLDDAASFLSPVGTLGDTVLVNGTPGPYLDVTTERVRLRLLNGSDSRVYDVGLADGGTVQLVGTDGGLLPAPRTVERVRLSPGDRAEVVVTMAPGQRAVLRSLPPELGVNPLFERFSGGDDTFDLLELRAAPTLAPSPAVPDTLGADPADVLDEADAVRTRTFQLSGRSINGRSMDMSRVDEVVTVGETEVWEVTGLDDTPHNFHVHDVQFRVLDVGGQPPTPDLDGWQDTVYVQPGRVTRLLVRFEAAEGATDPSTPYMFHCHLLTHEDQGMMGQLVVVAPGERAPSRIDVPDGATHPDHADTLPGDGTGPRHLAPDPHGATH
ncbi:multicopper oxidase family protein [Cellulosimicrobium cellulans]|uniref:multicopper oxidase family protein n=1 Tax=Cellulosimicrobium cellulans TaxID=1710 RepID=UPI0020982F16|nr:multicopper oxidase domain-containing protein [Cellulosimicrobium cellulans]MCO7272014.1 multicopper oxidase domain-containing protein [Cellulosimicrobium cellulans]